MRSGQSIRHNKTIDGLTTVKSGQASLVAQLDRRAGQRRIQNFVIGAADCQVPKFEFLPEKDGFLVHSGMTFYVQKGITKGIQNQQC